MVQITDRRHSNGETNIQANPLTTNETEQERALRHNERRRIRERLEKRKRLEAEAEACEERVAEIDRAADEAVADHQRVTGPLQDELDDIDERSIQARLAGKPADKADVERRAVIAREISEANARLKAIVPEENRNDEPVGIGWNKGIKTAPQTERQKFAARARELRLEAMRLGTIDDLARPGIGDPMLIARRAILSNRCRHENIVIGEAEKVMRMEIDGVEWDSAAIATWRRRKREAEAAIEVASDSLGRLTTELAEIQERLIQE